MNKDVLRLRDKFGGQATVGETTELYNAVVSTPAGTVVEVGSASGGTTIALVLAAQEVNKKVISVDPYPEELEDVAYCYPKGLMKQLKADFARNLLSGEYKNIVQYNVDLKFCLQHIPDHLSVVFIDGLHEYDSAMNEFTMLYPLVVPGGWIYIHDTCWGEGQLHRTAETSLARIPGQIDKSLFSETKMVESMFCGRK
jgi:predicted O-methyltransferase YrrM